MVERCFCGIFSGNFVRIKGRKIYSYPMKGTIDASLPSAYNQLMNDPKETAEHATIVDLIRMI